MENNNIGQNLVLFVLAQKKTGTGNASDAYSNALYATLISCQVQLQRDAVASLLLIIFTLVVIR